MSVSTLAVSSLLCKVFFTVWHERTMACREHSNSNLGKGSVLSSFTHPHVIRALWLSFFCGTEYCEECWFGDQWLPLCGQKPPHRDISQNIFCIPHKEVDHRGLKWHGMSKYWQNCWVNYPLRQSTSWTIKCSPTVQYKCAITLFIYHPILVHPYILFRFLFYFVYSTPVHTIIIIFIFDFVVVYLYIQYICVFYSHLIFYYLRVVVEFSVYWKLWH